MKRRNRHLQRRGLTLTELLVVISIVVILAGVMVPLMSSGVKSQDLREAARQVNMFVAGAQARAFEKGRPVGIWLERPYDSDAFAADPTTATNSEVCYRMHIAEVPQTYSGDTVDARVFIQADPDGVLNFRFFDPQINNYDESVGASARRLVKNGDTVKFNYRGESYRVLVDNPLHPTNRDFVTDRFFIDQSELLTNGGTKRPPPTGIATFQIYRQPKKTAAAPLELPTKTALDLWLSGVGTNSTLFLHQDRMGQWRAPRADTDIVIMFSPDDGSIDQVYLMPKEKNITKIPALTRTVQPYSSIEPFRPNGAINLLVGRPDKLGARNLVDNANLWVSINPRTGSTAVVPNAASGWTEQDVAGLFNSQDPYNTSSQDYLLQSKVTISKSRGLILTGNSMGGN